MKRPKNIICEDLACYVPREIGHPDDPQTAIPRIAKDKDLTRCIEAAVQQIPTFHELHLGMPAVRGLNRKVSTLY